MLKQWARSAIYILHGHKHVTINAKPMGKILKTGNDNFLAFIGMESLYQLMYYRFICCKLKLVVFTTQRNVITIPMLLSISHD